MNIPDHDDRQREYGEKAYFIDTLKDGQRVGRIVCYREGLRLIDFYRTSPVLAKDVKPPVIEDV